MIVALAIASLAGAIGGGDTNGRRKLADCLVKLGERQPADGIVLVHDPRWPTGYRSVSEATAALAARGLRPATQAEFREFARHSRIEDWLDGTARRATWALCCLDLRGPRQPIGSFAEGRPALVVLPPDQSGQPTLAEADLVEDALYAGAHRHLELHCRYPTVIAAVQSTPAPPTPPATLAANPGR